MRKIIIPIIMCMLVGFLLSKYFLSLYDNKQKIMPIFNVGQKLHFIQFGVYSSEESMKNNTKSLNYYIYNKADGYYYVYIGITSIYENAVKLKGYFKTVGYDTYIKEYNVSNNEFLESLQYYDQIIKGTNEEEVMKQISQQVLEQYEVIVNYEY